MKTRHAKGVPCPHNKGFSIEVERAIDIGCLSCKHILRTNPEAKKKFDKADPNAKAERDKKRNATKKEQRALWRDPKIPYKEKPSYMRTVPPCPKCKCKMAVRVNKANGARFWGCTTYPSCKGTRTMSK